MTPIQRLWALLAGICLAALAFLQTADAGGPNLVGAQWASLGSYCLSTFGCQTTLSRLNTPNARNMAFSRGDNSMVFVQVDYNNGSYSGTTNQTNCYNGYCWANLTGGFFPKVDEFSYFTVSDVWPLTQPDVVLVTVNVLQNATLYPTVVSLPWFPESSSTTGQTLYVSYRTVIITLTQGLVTNVDWEHTNCNLKACVCFQPSTALVFLPSPTGSWSNLDADYSTCASASVVNTTTGVASGSSMNIYLSWAGTDVNGNRLTSASYSIYKIENFV